MTQLSPDQTITSHAQWKAAEKGPLQQPPQELGDLSHRTHEEKLKIINGTVQKYYDALPPETPRHIADTVAKLREDIASFRTNVTEFFAPTNAQIAERYRKADRASVQLSPIDRARMRLDQCEEGVHVISDFDGTISDLSWNYLPLIPGSAIIEPAMQDERDKFPEHFAKGWRPILSKLPAVFYEAGQQIPIRSGVPDMLALCNEQNIPFDVLSANFEPVVKGGLSQLPDAQNVRIFAIKPDSIAASDKGTYLRALAAENPNRMLLYLGDGSSDKAALDAADQIGVFFALDGSSFHKELAQEQQKRAAEGTSEIIFFTYKTFHDIKDKVQELTKPKKEYLPA